MFCTFIFFFYRNLANHLYSKVYETQGDMCCKRNEIRLANLQLASIRAQVSRQKLDVLSHIDLCCKVDFNESRN